MNDSQPLLTASKNQSKLASIRKKLQAPTGGIYQGTVPDPEWGRKHLGETYDKVVLASAGVEEAFTNPEEYTVLGGWCALRTKDLQNIQRGFLVNPLTGTAEAITTIKQVSLWVKEAVSLDQIIQTVGLYNGNNYVLISEVSLWAKKIIRYLEQHFSRNLTPHETDLIFDSLEESETTRYKITKKYIEYTTKTTATVTRVRDLDIYHELQERRDELLAEIDTSLPQLTKEIIQNRRLPYVTASQNLTNLERYIDDYSLVLTMYTGHYLALLKEKKYVTTLLALIIEPWTHIRANNEAMAYCNEKIFAESGGKNNYLKQNGFNANLAFIATVEASDRYLIPDKVVKDISKVPNPANYHIYLNQRFKNTITNQPFTGDDIFSFAYNYYPYQECRALLNEGLLIHNSSVSDTLENPNLNQIVEGINEELQKMFNFVLGI